MRSLVEHTMKSTLITLLFCCLALPIFSQGQKNILQQKLSREQLSTSLVTGDQWITYPAYTDRKAWAQIGTPEIRADIIRLAEKALKHVWKPDLASDYFAYKRKGQILTGRGNHQALLQLTVGELIEGKGRFLDAIIDGAWFLCETSWVHSAHAFFQKDQSGLPDPEEPTVELVVADIGAQMAWTYHFFKDEFDKNSKLIARRIRNTVYERFINPYFARTDYWWMGLKGQFVNNWNIWINYNILQAVMLMEKDQQKKSDEVYRILCSADRFIDCMPEDGASEEGPTYWGHAGANLIKFLDLMYRATGGAMNVYDVEKVRNIGQYIYRVNVCDNYFVNFSDAAAKCNIAAGAAYQYGKCIGDEGMMGFASDFAKNSTWPVYFAKEHILASVLDDVLLSKELLNYRDKNAAFTSYFFKNSQLMVARDNKNVHKGMFVAAHGSNNGVSHNHNDVGSCMFYYNGKPVLIDVGVGTYTSKTFSSKRYTIWTMQSGYHNLPTINGCDEHQGAKYQARDVVFKNTRNHTDFTLDIAGAYPEEAKVQTWYRKYQLKHNREFSITDQWKLDEVKGETVFNFMTSCAVEQEGDKLYLLNGTDKIALIYDSQKVSCKAEPIKITDSSLLRSWNNGLIHRIRFTVKDMSKEGKCSFTLKPGR